MVKRLFNCNDRIWWINKEMEIVGLGALVVVVRDAAVQLWSVSGSGGVVTMVLVVGRWCWWY